MRNRLMPLIRLAESASPAGESEGSNTGQVCAQNIGPQERRKRLLFGVGLLAATLALAAILGLAGVSRWWRLALFFPFTAAAIGPAQARART